MNGPVRLASFATAIALAFAGAFAAGSALDPDPGTDQRPSDVPTRPAPGDHGPGFGGHR